ncbi:MAG TPA: GNAT family N-acetyltransferase [Acidimicrobiales bacterium]|nr:GNAT family N-acetyltransferase [Acidimicrobiales bacterium]
MIEVLETERLILRPFDAGDLDSLAALFVEESLWWFPLRRGMDRDETTRFLERVTTTYDAPEPSLHAVIERSTGLLAGYTGLSVPHFLPEVLPAVEVGWRLGENFRGKGYATEAAKTALEWGFTRLGLSEVISIAEPANTASTNVMDRLGFAPGTFTFDPVRELKLVVRSLSEETWRRTR